MAAEGIEELLFLDTSLIIAATVEAHPPHKPSAAFVDARVAEGRPSAYGLFGNTACSGNRFTTATLLQP